MDEVGGDGGGRGKGLMTWDKNGPTGNLLFNFTFFPSCLIGQEDGRKGASEILAVTSWGSEPFWGG